MNMVTSEPPKVNGQPKTGEYSASDNGVVTTNGAYNSAQSLYAYFGYEMIPLIAVWMQAKLEQFWSNFSLMVKV